MTPKSAHNKGKQFENWVAEQIVEMGLGDASREIGSGSGKRKGDIRANLPFLLECKNHKKLAIWESIKQAKDQAMIGNSDPDKWALIIREPRSPTENPNAYVVIDLHEFLKLLKKDKEPLVKEPDRQFKYDVTNLKNVAQRILKQLDD